MRLVEPRGDGVHVTAERVGVGAKGRCCVRAAEHPWYALHVRARIMSGAGRVHAYRGQVDLVRDRTASIERRHESMELRERG